jgi:hypothetical protein
MSMPRIGGGVSVVSTGNFLLSSPDGPIDLPCGGSTMLDAEEKQVYDAAVRQFQVDAGEAMGIKVFRYPRDLEEEFSYLKDPNLLRRAIVHFARQGIPFAEIRKIGIVILDDATTIAHLMRPESASQLRPVPAMFIECPGDGSRRVAVHYFDEPAELLVPLAGLPTCIRITRPKELTGPNVHTVGALSYIVEMEDWTMTSEIEEALFDLTNSERTIRTEEGVEFTIPNRVHVMATTNKRDLFKGSRIAA